MRFTCFLVNDQIAAWPDQAPNAAHGVTLHPAKLGDWLRQRAERQLPALAEVWCWKAEVASITRTIADWGGSSGLLAVRAALAAGHTRIILCGVPMEPDAGHFVRRRRWPHAIGFRRGWIQHRAELAPVLRSSSGWTRELFGAPTAEWLAAAGVTAA